MDRKLTDEAASDMLVALKEIIKWVRPSGYAPRRYADAMKAAHTAVEKFETAIGGRHGKS